MKPRRGIECWLADVAFISAGIGVIIRKNPARATTPDVIKLLFAPVSRRAFNSTAVDDDSLPAIKTTGTMMSGRGSLSTLCGSSASTREFQCVTRVDWIMNACESNFIVCTRCGWT
jgi:hypothetical protein